MAEIEKLEEVFLARHGRYEGWRAFFREFKAGYEIRSAEAAAALDELRDKVQVALTAETLDLLTLRQEIMIDGIDATITKLGLAPGKNGQNG